MASAADAREPPPQRLLKIGEVAQRAGVGVDTVRFYERRGVLPVAPRRASGYRMFRAETVERILLAKDAQRVGMTLDEITELLRLFDAGQGNCAALKELGEKTLERLDSKIAALQTMRQGLAQLLGHCTPTRGAACSTVAAIGDALAAGPSPALRKLPKSPAK